METTPILNSDPQATKTLMSSRIPSFAKMKPLDRIEALLERNLLDTSEKFALQEESSLKISQAESFIENCISTFALPLGIATNFLIDDEEILIPMAVEESSVVAAASFGAKLIRTGGGFVSTPPKTIATCQIQFFVPPKTQVEQNFTEDFKKYICDLATTEFPSLIQRGGGVHDVELRALSKPGYYVIHVHVDTCEAMGANIVNALAEKVGKDLPTFFPCKVGSKILTNLALHRLTTVTCEINFADLARDHLSGEEVANRICEVYEFADLDPFRATTHNKGIMNGIDPVAIATGNDWRAIEAGCHAYAAITGKYKPLTTWSIHKKKLLGKISLPICVGTVGGVTRLHPSAKINLKILGEPSSAKLSVIMASAGLAQNLSALRALGCEGIQKGHMALHEKNLEMLRTYDHLPQLSISTNKSKTTEKLRH